MQWRAPGNKRGFAFEVDAKSVNDVLGSAFFAKSCLKMEWRDACSGRLRVGCLRNSRGQGAGACNISAKTKRSHGVLER